MKLTSILRIWLTRSFKSFEFKDVYSKSLDYENLETLGLYVHIPFCETICSFCPYCKEVYDKDKSKVYKAALLREIDLVGKNLTNKKRVTSLYFGGGTPALMIEDLGDIIKKISEYFIIEDGIGVELRLKDVTIDNLEKLKSIGVNMISIGVQSFNEACLDALGREKTDYSNIQSILNKVFFDSVDMDLIFAIPNQTKESLKEDIDRAFSYGATQISTYPFIDFTFANNKYKPLDECYKKDMLNFIGEYSRKINLERTSVWTFAKKNSKKYSSITRDNFLGFGTSATTLLKNQFKINSFSIDGYVDRIHRGELPTSLTLDFTLRQRMVYYLFWASYSMKIDKNGFYNLFGYSIKKYFGFPIYLGKIFGLLEEEGDVLNLTDKGAYYYHYIEQAYTTAYIDKMWNISRKIPFPKKIVLK
ncbi:MAG: coproporphyrinogen-III oxidase family protein [Clostridiaceae bacterium]